MSLGICRSHLYPLSETQMRDFQYTEQHVLGNMAAKICFPVEYGIRNSRRSIYTADVPSKEFSAVANTEI